MVGLYRGDQVYERTHQAVAVHRPSHQYRVQAGDIETNPGSSYFWCEGVIRSGAPHLKCNACGNCSHKQQKCSGLSRIAEQKHSEPNGKPWTRSSHGNQPPRALPQTADVAQQGEFCHACGLAFRTGVPNLKCREANCTEHCHKKSSCSGISRYRSGCGWHCTAHDGSQKTGLTIAGRPIGELKKLSPKPNKKGVKCTICKKTIACNITPLSCSLCDALHQKFCIVHQGHIRDEVDAASKSGHWTCKKCYRPVSVASPASIRDEAVESSELLQTSKKDDIKILQ